MSLLLMLLAAQANAQTDPPPLKIKPVPVQSQTSKAPAKSANPTINYVPAKPKVEESKPVANIAAPAKAEESSGGSALDGLSVRARDRLSEEKKADAERRAELRREMTAVQEALTRALSGSNLDMAALKAALERRDTVMAQSRSKVTAAVLDLLGDVPEGERMVIARALIEGESAAREAAEAKPKPSPVGR